MPDLAINPAVAQALAERRPVVALESTVISHGLPFPHNRDLALRLESVVREAGATPATIGVVGGIPTIGLTEVQVDHFARAQAVLKLSRRDIGYAVAQRCDGATTVAATMALAHLAGIQVFATGGLGGVHRGARESWDISADLGELGRTSLLVVCAGAKAILDLPATLEMLETLGVAVVGYGTNELPAFYSAHSGLPLERRVDSPAVAAAVWLAHRQFGGGAGMVIAAPPPAASALDSAEVESAIGRALARAEAEHIRGAAVTPFLLAAMAQETSGESVTTNLALLEHNAHIAAEIAIQIANGVDS